MNALFTRLLRPRSRADASAKTVPEAEVLKKGEAEAVLQCEAAQGSAHAMAQLGVRLLLGRDGPLDQDAGAELIVRAAEQGHPDATALLATLTAAGGLVAQSWPGAFDMLAVAADLGSELAQAQLLLLTADSAEAARVRAGLVDADSWRRLRAGIDFDAWVTAPPRQRVCESPRVRIAEGVASPRVCDWLIERSRDRLEPGLMYDGAARQARWHADRTCREHPFDIVAADVVVLLLRARIAALISLPSSHMEPPRVFHYALGQEMKAHYDHVYGGIGRGPDGAIRSERVMSVLLYLNDDYEGGELDFIKAGFRHKGRRGDAVFFANVDPAGVPDRMSLHAGLPITRGEKWLLSQWVHDQPFVG